MTKLKDLKEAVKEYAKQTKRAWRETPPVSTKNRKKLEGK